MSIPTDAAELTFHFTLSRVGTPEDIAEFTLWIIPADGKVLDDDYLLDLAHSGHDSWVAHVDDTYWTTAVVLAYVSARTFLANGKTSMEQNFVPDTPWQGSATSASMPWETSLACSLYTYVPGQFVQNGKRKRGRYYLPPVASVNLDPSDSGYFKDSQIEAFFGDQVDFLREVAFHTGVTPLGVVGVCSRMDGLVRPVTYAVMDAKFDSQRRRENRQVAGRLSEAL